jgi:hypothetical protein
MDAQAKRSAVWVDWRGELSRTWVFLDGQRATGDWDVGDERVACSDAELLLTPTRVLHDRRLVEVLDGMPMLMRAVPESVLGLRQTKWLSDGVLREGSAGLPGRAIHEVVVFR